MLTNRLAIQQWCGGAQTRCQGLSVQAWLRTALATPHPIILDFSGIPMPHPAFWRAAVEALPFTDQVELWSRLTIEPLPSYGWGKHRKIG